MAHWTTTDFRHFEKRYRANFFNSITGFKSIALVGTRNERDELNLAIFNSIVHIGSNPPYIGFIVRPEEVSRHTLENILSTGEYTINHIDESFSMEAHRTSAKYPAGVSEFDACGLTPCFSEDLKAPYVKESAIRIGIELRDHQKIELNGTSLVIGEVKEVFAEEQWIQEDGFIHLSLAGTLTGSGLDGYLKTVPLTRYSYARPDEVVEKITFDQKKSH